MNTSTILLAVAGGVLIGVGSAIATVVSGRIPGISGVFGRLFRPKYGDSLWRVVFLCGLMFGAVLTMLLFPSAAEYRPMAPLAWIPVAGLLVGIGTRVGGGCTSGHGVCGVGSGAIDSIVATMVFMAAAIATVFVIHHPGA